VPDAARPIDFILVAKFHQETEILRHRAVKSLNAQREKLRPVDPHRRAAPAPQPGAPKIADPEAEQRGALERRTNAAREMAPGDVRCGELGSSRVGAAQGGLAIYLGNTGEVRENFDFDALSRAKEGIARA